MGRKADLNIYAHRDLAFTLDHFNKYFGIGLSYEIVFHPFIADQPYEIFNDRHMNVVTLPLRHRIPVVGFIFREKQKKLNIRKEMIQKYNLGIRDIRLIKDGFDHETADGLVISNNELTLPPVKPRSYAFCTDTSFFPKLMTSLKDIDLLYFEATFSEKDKKLAKLTAHTTAPQAARLAKKIGAGKLLIGHFSNRYKNAGELLNEAREIFPDTFAVEDGDRFSLD
jgi:ribonuclease Z